MELQWPLMIFTLFVCLGTGVFAWQGVLAFQGKAKELQMPALVVSFASIVIGGIGSFLHLEHWERIFNGFGHLTSGITQELIGIVVFVIVLAIYYVMLRRSDAALPKWCGVLAVVISIALVFVMGHSYDMASRPVWHTLLLPLYYMSNAAFFGALALMVIAEIKKTDLNLRPFLIKASLVAGIAQLVLTIAFVAYFAVASDSFTEVGYYFDPTMPTKALQDPGTAWMSILSGSNAPLFWIGVVAVGLLLPLLLVVLMRRVGSDKSLLGQSGIAVIAALAGGMCIRVIFYVLGTSVFPFY